jgi:hypothetical protein
MNISAQSWQDLQVAPPIDPKSIILGASLGGAGGTFTRSTNVLQAAWVASPVAFTGANTKIISADTTDASTTIDAIQWTFNHQMVNAAANIPPALAKTVFLRAGVIWDNQIEINLSGGTCNNVQLTFRDNLGTSGTFLNSAIGAVPVISFGSGLTGTLVLHLSLLQPGTYSMALIMVIAGNWSAFEMEWIVLP